MVERTHSNYDRIMDGFMTQMSTIAEEFEHNLNEATKQMGELLQDIDLAKLEALESASEDDHDSQVTGAFGRGETRHAHPRATGGETGGNIFD